MLFELLTNILYALYCVTIILCFHSWIFVVSIFYFLYFKRNFLFIWLLRSTKGRSNLLFSGEDEANSVRHELFRLIKCSAVVASGMYWVLKVEKSSESAMSDKASTHLILLSRVKNAWYMFKNWTEFWNIWSSRNAGMTLQDIIWYDTVKKWWYVCWIRVEYKFIRYTYNIYI